MAWGNPIAKQSKRRFGGDTQRKPTSDKYCQYYFFLQQ